MYLAVWIDDRKDTPDERIVLVTPLLKRLGAAVALLNSRKRLNADHVILSGDEHSLNRFAELLDNADDEWKSDNNDRLIEALKTVAAKAGCSVVPSDGRPGQIGGAVEVLAVIQKPRAGLYPRYITKEGKAVWDEIVEKYEKTIAKYQEGRNYEKMWAAAIIIYRRVAGAKGIRAFTRDFGQAHRGKILTETHRRVNRGNAKALEATQRATEMLAKEQLGSQLSNEQFYEAAIKKGRYYLVTFRVLKTPDADRAMELLSEKAWGRGAAGHALHRMIDHYTDVMVEPMGQKQLYFYIMTKLSRDFLEIMWPSLVKADEKTLLRKLGQMGRKWVKTGTMRALAFWDFEESE